LNNNRKQTETEKHQTGLKTQGNTVEGLPLSLQSALFIVDADFEREKD